MGTYKKMGRLAGFLFLINLIPYVIANMGILDQLLYAPDFLQELGQNKTKVGVAVLMEFISLSAMLGFSVLIFPYLKKFGNRLAIAYLGLRFVEFGILTIGIIKLLSIVALSEMALESENLNLSYIQVLADAMLNEYRWIGTIYMLVFALHCILFFYLLFKSLLVPKFIPILGLIGTLLIFVNIVNILFDLNFGGVFLFAPIGIIELILALWLLVFGFRSPQQLAAK